MHSHYEHVEVPDARYFKSSCYASIGPPSVAYYPFHEIFISLDITHAIALGLHLPEGTTAQLNGKTVRMRGSAAYGSVDVTVPIRGARHGELGNGDPREFGGRDPFTAADDFGPFSGGTASGHYLWYLFISETPDSRRIIPTPQRLIRGTVELPSMTINGRYYDSQTIPFEEQAHTEISPVNC
jgi:hypothetical protein